MNRKLILSIGLALARLTSADVHADAFRNLGFEAAAQHPLDPDQSDYYLRVPITNALPFWQGFINGTEQTNVFYTTFTLGAPALQLLSATNGGRVLKGNFSLWLHSTPMSSVSISQVGDVPLDAQSIRFLGSVGYFGPPLRLDELFGVFVNNEQLPVLDLSFDGPYHTYGADVSQFAGQNVDLRFTALNVNYTEGLIMDSISFSAEPVPEPSTLALWALAGCSVPRILRLRRKGAGST